MSRAVLDIVILGLLVWLIQFQFQNMKDFAKDNRDSIQALIDLHLNK